MTTDEFATNWSIPSASEEGEIAAAVLEDEIEASMLEGRRDRILNRCAGGRDRPTTEEGEIEERERERERERETIDHFHQRSSCLTRVLTPVSPSSGRCEKKIHSLYTDRAHDEKPDIGPRTGGGQIPRRSDSMSRPSYRLGVVFPPST